MKTFGLFSLLLGVTLLLGCGESPSVDDVADEVEEVVIDTGEAAADAVGDAADAVTDTAADAADVDSALLGIRCGVRHVDAGTTGRGDRAPDSAG